MERILRESVETHCLVTTGCGPVRFRGQSGGKHERLYVLIEFKETNKQSLHTLALHVVEQPRRIHLECINKKDILTALWRDI